MPEETCGFIDYRCPACGHRYGLAWRGEAPPRPPCPRCDCGRSDAETTEAMRLQAMQRPTPPYYVLALAALAAWAHNAGWALPHEVRDAGALPLSIEVAQARLELAADRGDAARSKDAKRYRITLQGRAVLADALAPTEDESQGDDQ